jgi:hypothetical protein
VTAPECPTTGYACVQRLMARVQACVDQSVGLETFIEEGIVDVSLDQVRKHTGKVMSLLQEALDEYTEGHGLPAPLIDVEAVEWVVQRVVK